MFVLWMDVPYPSCPQTLLLPYPAPRTYNPEFPSHRSRLQLSTNPPPTTSTQQYNERDRPIPSARRAPPFSTTKQHAGCTNGRHDPFPAAATPRPRPDRSTEK